MLATSKNVLLPAHKNLLPTGADDPSPIDTRAIFRVLGHQYWLLVGGYDLDIFRRGSHGGYLVDCGGFICT